MRTVHQTVLLQETITALDLKPKDIVVDMTLGGAGHTELILESNIRPLTLLAIDANQEAIEMAQEKLKDYKYEQLYFFNSYFDNLIEILKKQNLDHINKCLFDLGLSSDQLEKSGCGFSFLRHEKLNMRFGKDDSEYQLTAKEIVNEWEEENLVAIFEGYGEERFSKRIAKAIILAREERNIEFADDLAEIIKRAVPAMYRFGKIHPATKIFQALRIATNDELGRLSRALHDAFEVLAIEGIIAVITFHSLEDRIVKRFFTEKVSQKQAVFIHKRLSPSEEELSRNPRSRSAKLRVIKKI
jgi:16S rRNA (cytosine1402-N4)-methyltransferase